MQLRVGMSKRYVERSGGQYQAIRLSVEFNRGLEKTSVTLRLRRTVAAEPDLVEANAALG